MTIQTVRLAGKRFVTVEEKQYLHMMQELDKVRAMTAQDWGDVAGSKRRMGAGGSSTQLKRARRSA